ncbi:MAG: RsmE family RNA methyltransferase, partial [Synergistota bacterium]|nr:RsmE family RNA methyltransferase [Synergistota bacterium]
GDLIEGLLPGERFTMRLETAGRQTRAVAVSREEENTESPLWIVAAIVKPEAFNLLLRQVTEAGVTAVVPVVGHRTVNRTGDFMDRWNRILAEASKQCGVTRIPELFPPCRCEELPLGDFPPSRYVAQAGEDCPHIVTMRPEGGAVLATGPEGGWSPEEFRIFGQRGFVAVSLGKRVMRSPTAAAAGTAILRGLIEEGERNGNA